MSTSKLSAYANALQNEKSKKLLEELYAANPTAGSIYDLDVAAADAAHAAGKTQLDENRKAREAALEKNRAAQKRAASYSYAKLLNYLPEQLKAQGLHGQGVGQSALLNAYGSYRNEVVGADADYADRVSALEAAYKTDLLGLDATRDAAYHTALQNYTTRVDNTESGAALNEKIMEDLQIKFEDAVLTGDYTAARDYLEKSKDFIDSNTHKYFSAQLPAAVQPQDDPQQGGSEQQPTTSTQPKTTDEVFAALNEGKTAYERLIPKANGKTYEAKEITYEKAQSISKELGVIVGEKQVKAVQAVLTQSATWGVEKNGTLVAFNVGGKLRGAKVFVFYNGKWYETTASSGTGAEKYLEK